MPTGTSRPQHKDRNKGPSFVSLGLLILAFQLQNSSAALERLTSGRYPQMLPLHLGLHSLELLFYHQDAKGYLRYKIYLQVESCNIVHDPINNNPKIIDAVVLLDLQMRVNLFSRSTSTMHHEKENF